MNDPAATQTLAKTPLDALHRRLGARMAPFAGYDMPINFSGGILAEHLRTRESAGLFDASHMGQAILAGPGAARALETLVPGDIVGLGVGRTRYTQFLAEDGGVLDDLMATRLPGRDERLLLIVNASRKAQDFALLRKALPHHALHVQETRALLALQGPRAAEVLTKLLPGVADDPFMSWRAHDFDGAGLWISRSGYTGEDGFEISLPAAIAESFAETLLADAAVTPAGLGARDSLRLEAGLCLYGHELDETVDPIEAGLAWSIGERRRRDGGFPGFARIARALQDGPSRKRVGLAPHGKAPVRDGAEILNAEGRVIGKVTSGGHSPSLSRPIAMGYVEAAYAQPDAQLSTLLRGAQVALAVTRLPFVPHRYAKP